MDLLSASIRTVFYDTAVSSVVQDLRERRASHLEREFAKQISWRETAFTQTEAKNLADFMRSEVTAETSCDRPVKRHHCFRLLPRFTLAVSEMRGRASGRPVRKARSVARTLPC